jgi:hypothetical protein
MSLINVCIYCKGFPGFRQVMELRSGEMTGHKNEDVLKEKLKPCQDVRMNQRHPHLQLLSKFSAAVNMTASLAGDSQSAAMSNLHHSNSDS